MSSEKDRSGHGTGTTSTSTPPPDAKPESLSESEYLQQQAADARAAMGRALQEVKDRLLHGADPKLWAKQYPWITVGAAAVAGFAAAATLIPSKEEQALKKLAKIERALHPPPPPPRKHEDDGDGHHEEKPGVMGALVRELIGTIRPALISMLTAGVTGAAVKPSESEMEQAAQRENVREVDTGADPHEPPPGH
jgi:hypothetical protein